MEVSIECAFEYFELTRVELRPARNPHRRLHRRRTIANPLGCRLQHAANNGRQCDPSPRCHW
jgi:hypothetical protein